MACGSTSKTNRFQRVIHVFYQVDPKINFFKEICLNFLQNKNINKKLTLDSGLKAENKMLWRHFVLIGMSTSFFLTKAALRPSNDVFYVLNFW